jgi:hypothetical protein
MMTMSPRLSDGARRLFFETDPMAGKEPPDRPAAAGDTSLSHRSDDFIQCQIRQFRNQLQQPIGMLLQWRGAAATRLCHSTASFAPAPHPLDRRTGAHLKAFRRLPSRRTLSNSRCCGVWVYLLPESPLEIVSASILSSATSPLRRPFES